MSNRVKSPAGGGDVSPAAPDRSTSLASCTSGEARAVIAPPKPDDSPAAASADVFDYSLETAVDREDDTDDFAFPRSHRLILSASTDGLVSIHRKGDTGLVLTAQEAHTALQFLSESAAIWSRAL